MTAPLSRRTLIAVAADAAGVAALSRSIFLLLPDGHGPNVVLERLVAQDTPIGAELRESGRRVNEQSPDSVRRVNELAKAQGEGPFAPIVVAAGRASRHQPPVIIDGWMLPDLVAGIAGAAALQPEPES